MLDEDGSEERIVGRADFDGKRGTQSRAEIPQFNGPAEGRTPAGKQKAAPALPTPIVEVEEGPLGRLLGIVDRNSMPAAGDEVRYHFLIQSCPAQDDR